MSDNIGIPTSSLDIRLGQSPNVANPQMQMELQGIYNALHILNGYLDGLRQELEGTDSQDPSESLRFRRRFEGVAAQPIAAGDIVSPYASGIVKGLHVSPGVVTRVWNPAFGAPSRGMISQARYTPLVALADAAVGDKLMVGVPPGVIKVPGAKCGQVVWACAAIGTFGAGGATNGTRTYYSTNGHYLTGLGNIYTDVGQNAIGLGPGGWYRSGDFNFYYMQCYWPIGIAIANDFVILRDFVRDNLSSTY